MANNINLFELSMKLVDDKEKRFNWLEKEIEYQKKNSKVAKYIKKNKMKILLQTLTV